MTSCWGRGAFALALRQQQGQRYTKANLKEHSQIEVLKVYSSNVVGWFVLDQSGWQGDVSTLQVEVAGLGVFTSSNTARWYAVNKCHSRVVVHLRLAVSALPEFSLDAEIEPKPDKNQKKIVRRRRTISSRSVPRSRQTGTVKLYGHHCRCNYN